MRIGVRLSLAFLPLGAALLLPALLFPGEAHAWPRPDPGEPFTMTVDDVGCRSGRARVTLHNRTSQLARFDLKADGTSLANGSIPAHKTIVRQVPVQKGSASEIEAFSLGDRVPETLIESSRVENDCPWGHHHGRLPFTGPPTDLMGKLATAAGLVVMGGILWWYGSIWPRSSP
ncbi:hypothetical protein GCM10022224_059820 [Nonomuraea antimicrobica]|uniref:Uncharacterized protein n=1 Tax=Nonomuraea antimicrobica TaxID=561173 RepID=A0ABP7CFH7_9ACTN